MQSSNFNKRHGDDDTFLGVSKAKLLGLPSNVRGEVIAALVEADEAKRSGDQKREAAATEKVRKAVGALEDHGAERIVEKFFLESLRPLHGDHSVIRKFARRAGVEG
jgi:TRAP-type C4-dicarboxylate transport system substrate-binding protein